MTAEQADSPRQDQDVAVSELAGLRILVIGINYAPEFTGIAPYTTQACEDLVSAGAEVLVLAGVPHYPQWEVPPGYARRVTKEERAGVRVRRLRHVVPGKMTALSRGAYELTFGLNVLTQRLPWKPDAVLAVSPSLFGAAAGSVIARRTGAPMVLWLQDLLGPAAAQSGISGGGRVAGLTAALERWTIRRSALVVVLNDRFREYVHASGSDYSSICEVPNWTHVTPPVGLRDETRARLGWRDSDFVVLHTGNMGLKQGLENVIDTARLALARAPSLRFVLMGDGSQRRALEELAHGLPNMSFSAPAASENYTEALAAADLLLLSERGSIEDMSVPSKLTSYLTVDVPLIAAVRAGGGTADEVARGGRGVLVPPGDPHALLDGVLGIQRARANVDATDSMATARYVQDHLNKQTALATFRGIVAAAAREHT